MGELQELLIKLRDNRPYREISKLCGISHGYLRTLEKGIHPATGKIVMPSVDILKALSLAYQYPYEKLLLAAGYLDDGTTMECSIINEDVIRIPICSDIRNGRGIIIDYGCLPIRMVNGKSLLFLTVKDDCMISSTHQKDLALVKRQNMIVENTVGVVEIKDNGTIIRRVKYEGDEIILYPDNQKHHVKRYHMNEVTIIGEVVLFIVYTA